MTILGDAATFYNKLAVARPTWAIENEIRAPIDSTVNPLYVYLSNFAFMFRLTVALDQLFAKKDTKMSRSLEDDQLQIFKSMEMALATMGVDGKACLLRTICEMQKNPIGEMTIVGEVLTVMMTPRRGVNDFLHEYLDAERVGQMENATIATCGTHFPKCPMSIFNLFRSYSTPQDKPAKKDSLEEDDLQHLDLDEESTENMKKPYKQDDLENHYLMHVN